MKVIETLQYFHRDGTPTEDGPQEMVWGNDLTDLGVVMAVTAIIQHQKERDEGKIQNFPGRLKTLDIRITF